jgi:hypothetical protein
LLQAALLMQLLQLQHLRPLQHRRLVVAARLPLLLLLRCLVGRRREGCSG